VFFALRVATLGININYKLTIWSYMLKHVSIRLTCEVNAPSVLKLIVFHRVELPVWSKEKESYEKLDGFKKSVFCFALPFSLFFSRLVLS